MQLVVSYTLIPIAIFLLYAGMALMLISMLKAYHHRKRRRTPFTDKFLRGPGQSLMDKIDDISSELMAYMAMLLSMPLLLYSVYITLLYSRQASPTFSSMLIYLVGCIGGTGFLLFKLVKLFNLRRITRLGYEGEVVVGQELNRMMLQGYHVYHDFVADHFNIDHIVVGSAGVFAVETKARSKPISANRSADAKVTYDGKSLHFPHMKETQPIEQARRQAQWLEQWLSSATGIKTSVRPVVALPGWYVTRTSSDGMPVINPKQFAAIAKPINGSRLDDHRIKSIVHQIEQKCRNIESKAVEGLGGRG